MTNAVTIHPIPILTDNYVWAIIDNEKHTALVVDPGEAAPVKAFLEKQGLTLQGILITHHHWDHTNGVAELVADRNVPVFGSAIESIAHLTHPLREKDEVKIAGFPMTFTVIDIPGHTLGHIAYVSSDSVFCGDTLFSAGCGRIFEGTPSQMYETLQKIAALPASTKVYCGHEYTLNNLRFAKTVEPGNPAIEERIKQVQALRERQLPSLPSSLQDEKKTNPFLRCDSVEIIKNTEMYSDKKLAGPVEVFAELRKWKDQFK